MIIRPPLPTFSRIEHFDFQPYKCGHVQKTKSNLDYFYRQMYLQIIKFETVSFVNNYTTIYQYKSSAVINDLILVSDLILVKKN